MLWAAGCDEPAQPGAARKAEPANPAAGAPPEKAAQGVGEKGRGIGGGPITEDIHAYFAAKETIAFTIQIPHAMDLFYHTNDRYPKSHEEFFKEIIKANGIELPELPAGDKYKYDPDTHELMVEHPPH
jgi:hypothetical protein